MRSAFARFLQEHPQIRCIFVGVRSPDPYCAHLHDLDATDNGWPAFMRAHPILDWSYADVWQYLLDRAVPYCGLYDQGYTSLGSPSDTLPNPLLQVSSDGGRAGYLPAYRLKDEAAERAGRIRPDQETQPL